MKLKCNLKFRFWTKGKKPEKRQTKTKKSAVINLSKKIPGQKSRKKRNKMFDKKCEKWSTNKVDASIGAYQRGFSLFIALYLPVPLSVGNYEEVLITMRFILQRVFLFLFVCVWESLYYYLTSVSVFSGHFHSCWLSWWCTFEMLKVSNFQHFPRTYVWCALFGLWALNELHDLNVP